MREQIPFDLQIVFGKIKLKKKGCGGMTALQWKMANR
jgi:hypothetical protein